LIKNPLKSMRGNKMSGVTTSAICKLEKAQAKHTPIENPVTVASDTRKTRVKNFSALGTRPAMKSTLHTKKK
jgi:hypothetical protein